MWFEVGGDPEVTAAMHSLKVLIADDHRLMLAGIRRALDQSGTVDVVGEVMSGAQVLPAVGRVEPDVVLLDIRMPDLDGFACLSRIRARHPQLPVVMLSTYADPEHIERARELGANAYIVKSVDPIDLVALLHEIVATDAFSVHGLPGAQDTNGPDTLSEREVCVLRALVRGLSNRDIGKELWVTEQTVKFHLRNIYRKLEISSRTEAARYAYEHLLADAPQAASPL
jgi:DNA-binding NarL/FixJ family response regulator